MCTDTVEQIERLRNNSQEMFSITISFLICDHLCLLSFILNFLICRVRRLPLVITIPSFNINNPEFHYCFKNMSITLLTTYLYHIYMSNYSNKINRTGFKYVSKSL